MGPIVGVRTLFNHYKCGWKNGKRVKCGPNNIKIRKARSEDRANDMGQFLAGHMQNKGNFKGCIDCKFSPLILCDKL